MNELLEQLDAEAAFELYGVCDYNTYKSACNALMDSGEFLSLDQLQFLTLFKMTKIGNKWFKSFGATGEPVCVS